MRQLSVFFALIRYMVVKIARSSFEVILRAIKHTMINPGLGPSLEVIALYPAVWYRDEQVLQGVSRELEKSA
jgi:hypothetical protein